MIKSFFKNMFRDAELEEAKRMVAEVNLKLAKIEFTTTLNRDHDRINRSAAMIVDELHNDNYPKAFKIGIIDAANRYLNGWSKPKEIMYDYLFKAVNSPFYTLTPQNIEEANMDSIIRILQQYWTLKIYKEFIDDGNTNTNSEFYIEFDNYFKGIEMMITDMYPWVRDKNPDTPILRKLISEADMMYTTIENEMLEYSNIIIGKVDKIIKDLSAKNKDQAVHLVYEYTTSINHITEDGYIFEYVVGSYPTDDNSGILPEVVDAIRGRKSFIHLDSEECIFNLAMIKLIFSYLI